MPARIDTVADVPQPPVQAARVLVAARNEAARIGATIAALRRALPGAEVWVADDGSHDATGQIARTMGAHVLSTPRPRGKGTAMSAAASAALAAHRAAGARQERRGRERAVFVLCDGDLGDSAGELAALAHAVGRGRADVAVGAFAHREGGGFGIALAFARWAIRARCGLRTSAPISGQRALDAHTLEALLPFARGFGMEMGMTIDAVRAGLSIEEIQLELSHRASRRTLPGFAHRCAQLLDFVRVYRARSPGGARR